MSWLLHAGLSNAALAALLAVPAWYVTRRMRRPALAHALWLLVLLKLVTPPVVPVPVLPWLGDPPPVVVSVSVTRPEPVAPPPAIYTAVRPQAAPPIPAEVKKKAAEETMILLGKLIPPEMQVLMPPISVLEPLEPAPSVVEDAPAETDAMFVPAPAAAPVVMRSISSPPANSSLDGTKMLLGVWLAGMLLWLALAVRRVAKFRRWLRYAEPAPASLVAEVVRLARRMGLPYCPAVRLVPGPVPPLIWATGSRATLYFPTDLFNRLDLRKRETLLVHELAHLAHRDHWVRGLEILTLALYWWFPVAWLARRNLQRAEEECCDARVLEFLPGAGRTYAEALVDAVDFLAGSPALPAVASGITPADCIKRRLLMILHGTPSPRLTVAARLAVVLSAFGLLPLLAAPQDALPSRTATPVVAVGEPAAPVVKTDEEPYLFDQRPTPLQTSPPRWWSLAVSPDAKLIAVTAGNAEQTGELTIFDFPNGPAKTTIKHGNGIRTSAFSPDGKTLAVGYFDNSIRLFDVATWKLKAVGVGHTGAVNSLAFTADGKRLASASLDNSVKVWLVPDAPVPADDKAKPAEFKPYATLNEHTNWALCVAVSKDGKTIVSGGRDNFGRVWDMPEPAKDGKLITVTKAKLTLTGHTSGVECVGITPDGATIATGSWDGTARTWNMADGKQKLELKGHPAGINTLAIRRDGKELAVGVDAPGQQPSQVRRYSLEDGKQLGQHTHAMAVRGLAYHPTADELISAGEDRVVKRSNFNNNGTLGMIQSPAAAALVPQIVLAVAYSPDGKAMAVAGENKQISVYTFADKQMRTWPAHDDVISCLVFGKDGKTLISGSHDKTVKIWDLDGKPVATKAAPPTTSPAAPAYPTPPGAVPAPPAFAPTTPTPPVTVPPAGLIYLVPPCKVLKGHTNWIFCLAITRDGKKLASGGYDRTVRLWNLGDWKSGDAPPVTILKTHTAGVRSAAFSPDGTLLATGSADRTARIWNTAKGEQLGIIRGHKGTIRAVEFAPDGQTLATGSEDKTVKLWTLVTQKDGQIEGKERAELADHGDMVASLAYSPKGRTLAVGTWQGQVYLWDPILAKRRTILSGHNDAISGVAFAPDGQQLATVSYDRNVRLWPPMAPPTPGVLSYGAHTDAVWSIALSKDGKWAATGSRDGRVRIYERGSATPKFTTADTHTGGVTFVVFSPDSQTIASVGKDKIVRIWKANGEKVRELPGHTEEILKAAFHPDGKLLATAGADKDIRIWDLSATAPKGPIGPVKTLTGHTEAIHGLTFSADGKLLASAGMDRSWRLWETQKWETKFTSGPAPNNGHILALDISPDSKTLALAHSQDQEIGPDGDLIRQQFRNIMLVDTQTGKPLAGTATAATPNFNQNGGGRFFHPDWITGLAFTADGQTIITASRDFFIRFWNVKTNQVTRQFRAHNAGIAQLVVGPEDGLIATAGEDRVATLWSVILATQARRAMITGHSGQLWFTALTPDGQLMATGGTDKRVMIREGFTGSQPYTFDGTYRAVYSVAASPDGKLVATGHEDGAIEIWNAGTGKKVKTLTGHTMRVWSLAFTSDSKQLYSTGGDWDNKDKPGEVKQWNLDDGKVVREFAGHTGLVYNLALSKDGKTLVTASHDKTVRVWNLDTGKEEKVLTAHNHSVRAVHFSPDGKTLASCGNAAVVLQENSNPDGTVIFWNTSDWTEKERFKLPQGMQVNRAKFSPDGKTVVIAGNLPRTNTGMQTFVDDNGQVVQQPGQVSGGGRLLLYDVATSKVRKEAFPANTDMILDIAFGPNDTVAAVGGEYNTVGSVRFFNVGFGNRAAEVFGHKLWCETAVYLKDGRLVTAGGSAGQPGEIKVWNAHGVRAAKMLEGYTGTVSCAAFRPDKKQIATGDDKGNIILWDLSVWPVKGEVAKMELKGHTNLVRSLTYSADGKTLLSCAEGGSVFVWDTETGAQKKKIDASKKPLYSLALSPNGKLLATAAGNWQQNTTGEVKIWDVETGNMVKELPGFVRHVWHVSFSPDGTRLLTAGGQSTVKVWDTATWTEKAKMAVQTGVRAAVYSPDGKIIATASETNNDPIVRLWDAETGQERGALQGATGLMFCLKFSPDGKTLFACGDTAAVHVWDVPQPKAKPAAVASK